MRREEDEAEGEKKKKEIKRIEFHETSNLLSCLSSFLSFSSRLFCIESQDQCMYAFNCLPVLFPLNV